MVQETDAMPRTRVPLAGRKADSILRKSSAAVPLRRLRASVIVTPYITDTSPQIQKLTGTIARFSKCQKRSRYLSSGTARTIHAPRFLATNSDTGECLYAQRTALMSGLRSFLAGAFI